MPYVTAFFKTMQTLKFKSCLYKCIFAAVNHYDHKQQTLKHRNTPNRSKSTNNKITNHDLLNVLKKTFVF